MKNGFRAGMSRQANCWDNAAMESFFSRLKVELVYASSFGSIDEMKSEVFGYIDVFYNRVRRHSPPDTKVQWSMSANARNLSVYFLWVRLVSSLLLICLFYLIN